MEKRTNDLVVLPPPSPAKPNPKTAKTADVAPDPDDDGVSVVSGGEAGRHAEGADEVNALADRLTVFEEAFDTVAAAATKNKPSGYVSEDNTHPDKSPNSELRHVITAVQRGLQKSNATEAKTSGDLANTVCERTAVKKKKWPMRPRRKV